MSVIKVEEVGDSRSMSFRRKGRTTVRTYQRSFEVFTDDGGTGQLEAILSSGVPLIGDTYAAADEFDTGATVEGIEVSQSGDNNRRYRVVVSYSSEVESELTGKNQGSNKPGTGGGNRSGGGGMIANPLSRRPRVDFTTRTRRVVLEKDFHDIPRAMVNSAGEHYDPPVEVEIHNQVIHINATSTDYDVDITREPWINSVNLTEYKFKRPKISGVSPTVITIPIRAGRITKWDVKESEENSIVYHENDLEIEVQLPSWDLELLNQGNKAVTYNPQPGSQNSLVYNYDNGNPMGGKVNLDEFGVALPNTTVATAIAAGVQFVTPKSMYNLAIGSLLVIDPNTKAEEEVKVTNTTGTTFEATFINAHTANFRVLGKPTYKTFYPFVRKEWGLIPLLSGIGG